MWMSNCFTVILMSSVSSRLIVIYLSLVSFLYQNIPVILYQIHLSETQDHLCGNQSLGISIFVVGLWQVGASHNFPHCHTLYCTCGTHYHIHQKLGLFSDNHPGQSVLRSLYQSRCLVILNPDVQSLAYAVHPVHLLLT